MRQQINNLISEYAAEYYMFTSYENDPCSVLDREFSWYSINHWISEEYLRVLGEISYLK